MPSAHFDPWSQVELLQLELVPHVMMSEGCVQLIKRYVELSFKKVYDILEGIVAFCAFRGAAAAA